MSAPPIMLFSLSPATIRIRIARSRPSVSSPSRRASMTAEPRMFSDPALQMVSRTTPRGSRSTPQYGLSMSMAGSGSLFRGLPARATARQVSQTRLWRRAAGKSQINAAFACALRYYMTSNILWTGNALLERPQAGNPRPDREKGLGAASRKGRARHRRRRPDEGGGAYPWRLLRAFRFAGGAGNRGLCLCDGPLDRALAQDRRTDPARQAPGDDRGNLSDAGSSRRSRP